MTQKLVLIVKRIFTEFLLQNKNSNLGRWNSVVKPVPIENNKYIDWGNTDHCCCSFHKK